ncbi:hypothetical protein Q3D15_02285 [Enterococcus faecium]|nr:hypothetical protein [Enterococcus faecium]
MCGSGSWVVTGIREIDGSSGTTSVVACCSALIVYVSWACVWTGVAAMAEVSTQQKTNE